MPLPKPSPKTKNILSALTLYLLSITVGYFISYQISTKHAAPISPAVLAATDPPTSTPVPPPPDDLSTLGILLLGYGGAGHQGGYLTDVIMLVYFDFEAKTLTYISIPRDLFVNFPDGVGRKVNTAFAQGLNQNYLPTKDVSQDKLQPGGDAAKAVATTITGLPINYFIAIDFVGFQRAIGQDLGGIQVNVPQTLDDPWYPVQGLEVEPCGYTPEEITALTAQYSGFELEKQFPCRYEHLHFDPGPNHMEGGDALKFVRSRHSSSDFARAIRQQALLEGIKQKLFDLKAFDDSINFFIDLSRHTHTDIDKDIVTYLTPALLNLKDFQVTGINLSTENTLTTSKASTGAFILIPNQGLNQWTQIHSYINNQLTQ